MRFSMSCQTVTCAFHAAWIVTTVGLFSYFMAIYKGASDGKNGPANEESRMMYFETMKTVVTAAGLAIPIIGAALKDNIGCNRWMLQRAAVYLLAAVVFAVVTLLEMSRRYEIARQETRGRAEQSLADCAKSINQAITTSGGDYTGALSLALEFCRKGTVGTGLQKWDLAWLCFWAYLSLLGFIVGLLYVVRFVICS